MRHDTLDHMVKGWFVGAFEPAVAASSACEVAVKHYKAGDHEALHYHKIAVEITTIISGRVRMLDGEWGPGDILTIDPGEATAFEALTDAVTVVVKLPSALGDKYVVPLGGEEGLSGAS